MAINPELQYPGKINPSDADYPYGSARNITVPGDGTGTPWEAALVNDLFGWQQALLYEASVVPSATPEKVGASQYLEALIGVHGRKLRDISSLRNTEPYNNREQVVIDGHTVAGLGGGAFYYDSSDTSTPDNDGTVVVTPGGARWKRFFSGPVDVRWFGAILGSDSTAAINAAAAEAASLGSTIAIFEQGHVSTSTTQTKYVGNGSVVLADLTTPNAAFLKLFSGDTNKAVVPLACVIRQDSAGSGWYFIDDSGHTPNGFESLNIDPGDDFALVLNHSFNISKIGSVNVTPDEWYAKAGMKFGNSVSSDLTKLFAHKDAVFTVGNFSQSVLANSFFGNTITAVKNGDNTITVTHPETLAASDEAILCAGGSLDEAKQVPVLVGTTSTTITYALYSPLAGYVFHNGVDWEVVTNAASTITVAADSGGLTLTHSNLQDGIKNVNVRDGAFLAFVDTNNPTTTRVIFRDFTGALVDPTVSPVNKRFYFSGSELVQQKATHGQTKIYRPSVAVKWENLFGSTGNIWVGGSNAV